VFANYAAFEGTKLGATSLTSFLIQTSIIVLAAYLSYTFIEKRPYKKPLKLSLLYSASIFAIVTIGTLIQDNRFSNEQRKIFFAWEDRAVYRCGKLFRLIHPASDICSLNANAMGTTPILLVGNSHADSIKTIFAKVAREYNYETFFYVSNTPLMKGSPIQAEKVLADAIKIGADNIFLHYPPPPKGVDIDQLELLTKHAAKENINVTLILPVPVYSYHVPKALYNASQTNFELAQYSYEDYLNHNAIELSTVNKITNLKTIELADVFCSPTCKIKNEEGSLLYFDSSHLTLSGARMIESRLKENFNALRKQ
jgi:hypothetical protein